MLNNKIILVTGGTGSFGQRFIKTIIKKYKKIKKIIIFSRDELKQYDMSQELNEEKYKFIRYFIGDIRDRDRLDMALKDVDIVVHAAALKQVPASEYNPFETIKTNILGTQNIIDACMKNKVKKLISLSTDKASSPINLYGATKLCADKLVVASKNTKGKLDYKACVVRYGNVLGSRGSVLPLFTKQKERGNISITSKDMTRFNILLDEGIELVLWSIQNVKGGEIFVPKIPSYRITDLAKAVAPNCKINFIGVRPGEKIHEEMISVSEGYNTIDIGNYYVILPVNDNTFIQNYINEYKGKKLKKGFSYNSEENTEFLNVDELKKLIIKAQY